MELNRLVLIAALFMIVNQHILTASLKCLRRTIQMYVNNSKKLVEKMMKCAVTPLNGTIVIPLVDVVQIKWAKKNETVREIEILSNLRMLSVAMAVVNKHAVPDCAKGPLKTLTKNIEDRELNFRTFIEMKNVTSYTLEDSEGRNTSKILEVVECYQNLMEGKIKSYLLDGCPATSR